MEKNKWHAFLFLLPSIFFFVVFSYWPLLQNLYLSFFSWNMVSPNMTFVGIENYTAVLGSEVCSHHAGAEFCAAIPVFVCAGALN